MSDKLSCPVCGYDRFTAAPLSARIEYTYSVNGEGFIFEQAKTIVDGGDISDVDAFTCDDCGEEFCELSKDTLCTGDDTCRGYGNHEYCEE